MNFSNAGSGRILIAAAVVAASSGCGGSKLLREPQPLVMEQSLAEASDASVAATLDWVIVRDGPGTWARNADWDEYLVSVRNHSTGPISVTAVTVTDSSGTSHASIAKRKILVRASRRTAKRYKGQGINIKAGIGGGALVLSGVVAAEVGASLGSAAVLGGSAVAGTALGALVAAPVLVVGGVVKGVNNGKVSDEIERRQTPMPIHVEPGARQVLDLFFPIAPSPREVRVDYTDASGVHTILIDTAESLDGLHLPGRQPVVPDQVGRARQNGAPVAGAPDAVGPWGGEPGRESTATAGRAG